MASENETVADIVKELRDEPLAENGAKPWLHYLADRIEATHRRDREAAARLRSVDDYAEMCGDAMREVSALRAKLKVAEDALNYVMSVAAIEEAWSNTSYALAAIREEGGEK